MIKITNLGHNTHAAVSARIMAALATLQADMGVTIEFTDAQNGVSPDKAAFDRNAFRYGLKPEWFGVQFWSQGTAYKIVGLNLGSPKFAVKIERVRDGKVFKGTVQMCVAGLQAAVAAGRIAA